MTLDRTFGSLADPTRRAIVDQLRHGPATVSTLAAPHRMSLPAVMKHVTVLERSGLITRAKQGRTVTCTLRPGPLAAAHEYLAGYERFWSDSLNRLEDLLAEGHG